MCVKYKRRLVTKGLKKIPILLYLKRVNRPTMSLYMPVPICKQNGYIFLFHMKMVVLLFCFRELKGKKIMFRR